MEEVKQIHNSDIVVGDTTSSTGSNYVINGEEVADGATSNSINKHKLQPKAESGSVGYIFMLSDGKTYKQQRDENNLLIAQAGPYESTAESAIRSNDEKYTTKTIRLVLGELVKLEIDQYTFSEAYDLLVHNAKETKLFFGYATQAPQELVNEENA